VSLYLGRPYLAWTPVYYTVARLLSAERGIGIAEAHALLLRDLRRARRLARQMGGDRLPGLKRAAAKKVASLVPQCLDRVEPRRPARRQEAEEHADRRREGEGDDEDARHQ